MKTRRECAHSAMNTVRASAPTAYGERYRQLVRREIEAEIRRQRLLGTVHLAGPECRDERRRRKRMTASSFGVAMPVAFVHPRWQRRALAADARHAERKASAYSRKGVRS